MVHVDRTGGIDEKAIGFMDYHNTHRICIPGLYTGVGYDT
jgi:hypothetical protein